MNLCASWCNKATHVVMRLTWVNLRIASKKNKIRTQGPRDHDDHHDDESCLRPRLASDETI